MSGKTGWLCYAKKSGRDILYKKMKSKNVSLAVEIYPREGTETCNANRVYLIHKVEIYPREGTETLCRAIDKPELIPVEIYPREGTETLHRPICKSLLKS